MPIPTASVASSEIHSSASWGASPRVPSTLKGTLISVELPSSLFDHTSEEAARDASSDRSPSRRVCWAWAGAFMCSSSGPSSSTSSCSSSSRSGSSRSSSSSGATSRRWIPRARESLRVRGGATRRARRRTTNEPSGASRAAPATSPHFGLKYYSFGGELSFLKSMSFWRWSAFSVMRSSEPCTMSRVSATSQTSTPTNVKWSLPFKFLRHSR